MEGGIHLCPVAEQPEPPNKNHSGHIKALAQSTAWSVLPYVCTLILSTAPPFDGGRLLAGVCCGVAVLAVCCSQR